MPHTSARPTPTGQPSLVEAVRALRKLYATLLTLECKGLCAESCLTAIDMSQAERARIEAITGQRLPELMWATKNLPCPLLTADGKSCEVYRLRPMICRTWGMTKNPKFRCPHGCEPDRWLTDVEVTGLLMDSYEAGLPPVDGLPIDEIRELLKVPEVADIITRWVAGEAAPEELYAIIQKHRGAR